MDRKQEILEAAAKSFTMFGYKATTMEQVSKIANVGKGTIYTFFSNKEELLKEIVLTLIRDMTRQADAVMDPTESVMENAQKAMMKLLQFREQHLLYAKLIEEEKALRTPAVKQMLLTIEEEIIAYVTKRIENGIVKGEIQPCDAEMVAYLLLKAYFAFILDWQELHEEPLPEEKIWTLFKDTIFRGLAMNG